jgi:hypothetical protein
LISAQFSNGDTEVLCAGTINATDTGVTNGSVSGNLVPNGATYNGSGNYTLTGLTNGSYYYWGKGANDSTCGSLSSNGNFIESGTTIVLTGTPSAAVTAIVQQVSVPSNVSGIYPIPNGQNYLVVTGLSIPFTPRGIQCTVMSGSGDGSIGQPQVVQSTISSTGFTVNFQGSTTSSNYYLIWTAIQ